MGEVKRPRCGVWMPVAKEPCAMPAGHNHSHRTQYNLDNRRSARSGKWGIAA